MRKWFLAIVLIGFVSLPMVAQPLADRIPADALIAVSWQGTDHMPQSFDRTHLKALIDASAFRPFVNDFLPRVVARVGQENPDAGEKLKLVLNLLTPMLKHPTAAYFAGVNFDNPGGPLPRIALLCQPGTEADAFAAKIDAALKAGPPGAPIRLIRRGDIVALSIGYDKDEDAVVDPARSLMNQAAFKEAMSQVIKEPIAFVYFDVEAAMGLFEQAIQRGQDEGAKIMIPKIKEAVGLNGLRRLAWSCGFEGQNFASAGLIAAPAPRKGLLSMLDAEPLPDSALKAIPATATSFSIVRFDLAQLIKAVREGANAVDPNAGMMVNQGLGGVQMATQINLPVFAAALGDTWTLYTDPNIAGTGPLGTVIVNHLRDEAEALRDFQKIEVLLDNVINSNIPPQEKIHIGFEQFKAGDLTVHYVALPFAAPSWAVKDGILYMGLYPQVVVSAAEAAKGKSILDNEAFQQARKSLGVEKPVSLSFADVPRTIGDTYPLFLVLTQTAGGFGDLFGVKSPPMILPTLSRMKEHLSPAAGASWTDASGWHYKNVEPFPMSSIVASQPQMLVFGGAMMAAVALPAAQKARMAAADVQEMNQLRQIGVAVLMYSADHQGKFPADAGELVKAGLLPIHIFVGPGRPIPPEAAAAKPEAQAEWVNANSDFTYIGGGLTANAPAATTILAYQKAEAAQGGRVGVLFADGHVEMMIPNDAMDRVKAQGK